MLANAMEFVEMIGRHTSLIPDTTIFFVFQCKDFDSRVAQVCRTSCPETQVTGGSANGNIPATNDGRCTANGGLRSKEAGEETANPMNAGDARAPRRSVHRCAPQCTLAHGGPCPGRGAFIWGMRDAVGMQALCIVLPACREGGKAPRMEKPNIAAVRTEL